MKYYLFISMLIIFVFSGCSTKIKRTELREQFTSQGFPKECIDKYIDLNSTDDIDSYNILDLMDNLVKCKKNGLPKSEYISLKPEHTTPSLANVFKNTNDKDGFDKDGFDKDGFDKDGFDKDGFDKDGYNNLKQNKKELVNKRLKTLINSAPNIDVVIESNLKKQKKDKYESDAEYLGRMKNLNFQTSGIIDINITKEYNPNEKIYKIIFETKSKSSGVFKVKYGADSTEFVLSPNLNDLGLSYIYKSSTSKEERMNVYGTRVNVTEYYTKSIVGFPDNFEKIKNAGIITCSDKTFNPSCFISFPLDKEKAKKLDKEELKLRVNLEFVDIYDIYNKVSGAKATLKNPVELISSSYEFNARIKEMIVLNQSTNEILFSYVDLNKN